MWTDADTLWTHTDCLQKCGQMWTMNVDSTKPYRDPLHAKSNQWEEVWYTSDSASKRSIEAIKLALLPVNDPARIIFVDTADKRWRQMRNVCNNVEKCRPTVEKCGQTADKCGETADMWEWKSFNIERLCLVTYSYLCTVFTIFFSHAKVHMVHST